MDPVTFLVFDALLTGILIFGFQKYWEYRYSQKQFQGQLKSKMIHEKRVVTLETLFKKYSEFMYLSGELQQEAVITRPSITGNNSYLKEKLKVATDKIQEVRNYFNDNRLYLPESLVEKISNIVIESIRLNLEMRDIIFRTNWEEELDKEKVAEVTKYFISKNTQYIWRPITDIPSLLNAIWAELFLYQNIIEAAYRSIADIEEEE
jgi:hypothetical protein